MEEEFEDGGWNRHKTEDEVFLHFLLYFISMLMLW